MVIGPRNSTGAWTSGFGDAHADPTTLYLVSTHPELGITGSGINGASYTAAAALYKNLGYAPEGYDMIDNDGNGLVDDWLEGISGGNKAQIVANLQAHKHNTARAEMLYAILVEGAGPLGSVFNRDDFTDKEVRDTDGDGLPEFVDAWGQPLQFFRWPLLYHSDIQRGQAFVSASATLIDLIPPYATRTPLANYPAPGLRHRNGTAGDALHVRGQGGRGSDRGLVCRQPGVRPRAAQAGLLPRCYTRALRRRGTKLSPNRMLLTREQFTRKKAA